MKYDDASWHYGGKFPKDLSEDHAFTHIGMFLTWALLNKLGGEFHVDLIKDDFGDLLKRKITPGKYCIKHCDGKLTDEDLNNNGNRFASIYYENQYYIDYNKVLGQDKDSIYHVEDTWANYEKLQSVLTSLFIETTKGSL